MSNHILVIDEGTTSTRAIAFDRDLVAAASSSREVELTFPADGHGEQDGEAIFAETMTVCREVIARVGGVEQFSAIAIANQRETTLLWDRASGKPMGPAIIWQDRRTADACEALRAAGHEARVQDLTGLLLDPYFSASKLGWMLDHVDGARDAALSGAACFGTVDSWLLFRLTGGRLHKTDITNASRTLLLNLETGGWDEEMCALFDIPVACLPDIHASAFCFGETQADLFGKALPVLAMIGDQQAALVGQGCLTEGEAKITYGTGAFLVANAGAERPHSRERLLATSGYATTDRHAFALEGSIFNAGTVVKWLRDELGLFADASETSRLAEELPDTGGVYFVPAFTGLGAPHWAPQARGSLTGLSRGTRAAHIVRAGLEATAYQTLDLLNAFERDGVAVKVLRVDGGMAANDWLMQFLADICDRAGGATR